MNSNCNKLCSQVIKGFQEGLEFSLGTFSNALYQNARLYFVSTDVRLSREFSDSVATSEAFNKGVFLGGLGGVIGCMFQANAYIEHPECLAIPLVTNILSKTYEHYRAKQD